MAFLRGYIEKLDEYFGENEVDEIWITFPDPFPKPSKENKRLTSKRFLDMYRKLVKPGGMVHFKTDNQKLFEYSLDEIESEKFLIMDVNRDVHRDLKEGSLLGVRTYYENKFIEEGKKINYLKFQV